MSFVKVTADYSDNYTSVLYDGCYLEVVDDSDSSVVILKDIAGNLVSVRKRHCVYENPPEDLDLSTQPCYQNSDSSFSEGDFVRDSRSSALCYVEDVSHQVPMLKLRMADSGGYTFWGRADHYEKVEFTDDNTVGEDYLTGQPLHEDAELVEIHGFDRYGNTTDLGYCYSMNTNNSRFVTCYDCDQVFDSEDAYFDSYWHSDGDTGICENCYARHDWSTCEDCGALIQGDSIYYDDDGTPYCETCWYENDHDDDPRRLHDYGYKPDPIFHTTKQLICDQNTYFGVELEVDKGGSVENCLEDLNELNDGECLFYCKHDGSLNDGIEIVSHPCDLDYHMTQFPWEHVMQTALDHGFKSHDAKTCGLHVHVSRNAFGDNRDVQDLNIAKVIILVDRFWDELVTFSRRDYNQLDRWAKKPDAKIYSYDTEEIAVAKSKQSSGYDRYKAINLTNRSTVEFRLFRGTLKLNTFKATLQFVQNLVDYVKSVPLAAVQDARWDDVARFADYPELESYLKEKNLYDLPDKPKPEEPKPVVVRFKTGDVVWFATENTDNEPTRGVVQSVHRSDDDMTLPPLYVVEDSNGHTNFLIDEEILDDESLREHENEYLAEAMPV